MEEQRLHIGLEQGGLIDERRVEDHIRAVLEGEDVPLLPPPDGGPHLNGSPGAVAPGPGVPGDPPQEPGVGGGDAVVVVHIQGGQAADIDSELALPGQGIGEGVVEAVDALDHQNVPRPQGQGVPVVLPDALFEVVVGELHGLPPQQAGHVLVELLHVHGVQALKVRLAVLVQRRVSAVFEVVVRGDGVWVQAAGDQLGGEPVGKGGLSGGGGAGDHHKADVRAVCHGLRNVPDPLFHHGLAGQDHLRGGAVADGLVQVRHIGDVDGLGALVAVIQGAEHLQGGLEGEQLGGVGGVRQPEDQAAVKQLQLELPEVPGVGDHIAVEVVGEILQLIVVDPGVDPESQQLCLVRELLGLKQGDGVVSGDRVLPNGDGLGGKLPHVRLHPVQKRLVQAEGAAGQDEQGVAEGVLHGDALDAVPAQHIVKGLQHQENGASLIGLHAGPILDREQLQRAVPVQGLPQLAQLPVPVHQQDVAGVLPLKIFCDPLKGRAGGVGVPVLSHRDEVGLFHRCISFPMLRRRSGRPAARLGPLRGAGSFSRTPQGKRGALRIGIVYHTRGDLSSLCRPPPEKGGLRRLRRAEEGQKIGASVNCLLRCGPPDQTLTGGLPLRSLA